ncbi:MAG TPA: prolipoprotein diacylglyceryl transferase [Dehalococcoidia bacterium]|nr:prolipoprotein diacylglyceryl transferase [Dehalococcoidia bacterium]
MFHIDINPVAFSIGSLEIRWYGIMVVLAIIAIIAISLLEARRMRIPEEHVYNLAIFAVIGGVIFSRLVHVIDRWDYYSLHPAEIVGFEGVAIYGAVIGVLLAVVIYCLVRKLSIWMVGDMIAPGALVGMAIGRVGCLLNGCCFGLPSEAFCSVIYDNPNTYAPLGLAILPTQVIHIIWNMLAFALVWMLRKRLQPRGTLFLLYLALYAGGDLIIRFFREGSPWLFGMQQAQIIGIIMLLVTIPWMVVRIVRFRKGEKVQAPLAE